MAKNTAVFGIYRDRTHVEQGVDALVNSGFRAEDVSVLLPSNVGTKDFAHEKHTKAPEGAATGAGSGAGPDLRSPLRRPKKRRRMRSISR